jgi:tetraacyldisaccharide 4'-kinase
MQPLGSGFLSTILSGIFNGLVGLRNFLFDNISVFVKHAARPVVSIGGVDAGGTGKTPMALLVGRQMQRQGRTVVFLSRGYRRRGGKMVLCRPGENPSWKQVGDEPALLHAALPGSWMGIFSDRVASARVLAKAVPADAVFILDDGFQHRRLFRDVDIVCLSADPFTSAIMPSGTLREPLANCGRAHILCVIGQKTQTELMERTKNRLAAMSGVKNVFLLYQSPAGWKNCGTGALAESLPLKNPAVLCGIARPQRFLDLVSAMHIHPVATGIYNDHHAFTGSEIQGLVAAGCDGIITTEKDAVRLRTLKLVNCQDIWYLKIGLAFIDPKSEELFNACLNGLILP